MLMATRDTLGNGIGKVWYKGKLVPTIGSICMDMTMIDITEISGCQGRR